MFEHKQQLPRKLKSNRHILPTMVVETCLSVHCNVCTCMEISDACLLWCPVSRNGPKVSPWNVFGPVLAGHPL